MSDDQAIIRELLQMVGDLKGQIGELQGTVNGLRDSVARMDANLNTMDEQYTHQIEELHKRIQSHKREADEASGKRAVLSGQTTSERFGVVNNEITEIKESLASMTAKVDALTKSDTSLKASWQTIVTIVTCGISAASLLSQFLPKVHLP